ncbi:hypothetical protein [Nocardia sp. SSK8]|uniref:hypothetical protein n=1 Tax=Nocardia sp. SSK8 TaxID=3120154 RepID=UPI003008C0F3
MGAVKTLDDINTALADFSTEVEKIRNSPSDVDKAFRKAQIAMAATNLLGNASGIGTALVMERDKKEVKSKITDLLTELQGAIDALQAPIALLNTSKEWTNVQTQVNEARNWILTKAELRGFWSGGAAEAYLGKMQLQIAATDTASEICGSVSNQLGIVSDAAWEFYSNVAADLVSFFVDFTAALTKIATGVAAPIGISDVIDALAAIIKKVMDYGVKLGAVLMVQALAIKNMSSDIDNPRTFHKDKWPEIGADELNIDKPNDEKWSAR